MREKTQVLKSIVLLVVTAHALMIYLFHFNPFHAKPKKVLAKRVLRENFRMIEKPVMTAKTSVAKSVTLTKPQQTNPSAKKTNPSIKKETKPAAIKKESSGVKKTALTNLKTQKQPIDTSLAKDLLKEWPQETSEIQPISTIEIPKALTTLEIENLITNQSNSNQTLSAYSDSPYSDYLQELITYAFRIHKIAQNGIVRLEFTLNNKGKLINIEVISSTDVRSKEIAIETVKKLHYLEFFGELADKQEYTFKCRIEAKDYD